jgi:regulator of replication initiation timing
VNVPPLSTNDADPLQQQLQQERQRVTELQRQLDTMNRQQSQAADTNSLYTKIEQLSLENRQLQEQLGSIIEKAPGDAMQTVSTGPYLSGRLNTRTILLSAGFILILGTILGIYIMDYINRKRHGGFRI